MIDIYCENWQPAPGYLNEGEVLFAIGDVHGHADHLRALQDFICERIRQEYRKEKVSVVWLGDYIDRGPLPREALDLARSGLASDDETFKDVRQIRLKGNHEKFLLDFIDQDAPDERDLLLWRMNGGGSTISALLPGMEWRNPKALAQALRRSLGAGRLDFLNGLQLTYRAGSYICVHAGLNPARDLEHQAEEDLLWIREPFLNPTLWTFDLQVVHGHTPQIPSAHAHRIGVDSGVYMSGQLTAVELRGREMRFITGQSPIAKSFDWDYFRMAL